MDTKAAKETWDVFMFGIPLLAFLVFGFFRLDQAFLSRKTSPPAAPNPSPAAREHHKSMRSDPDGTPWDDD